MTTAPIVKGNGRGNLLFAYSSGSGLPLSDFGNVLASRFNPDKFSAQAFVLELEISDRGEILLLDVGEDVLFPRIGKVSNASISLSIDYSTLENWLAGSEDISSLTSSQKEQKALEALRNTLDTFDGKFNVAIP